MGPRWPHGGHRRAQGSPKMAQEGPKVATRESKRAPRWPQDGPRWRNIGQDNRSSREEGPSAKTLKNHWKIKVFGVPGPPGELQDAPRWPKNGPKMAHNGQRSPQDGPKLEHYRSRCRQDAARWPQDEPRWPQDAKTLIFPWFFQVFKGRLEATGRSGPPTTLRAGAPGEGREGDKSSPLVDLLDYI